nr:hypothetical protein [Tanacetum cinerariifolium]
MMQFMQNLYNKPSTLSSLPSNTIPNPKGEAKVITIRSDYGFVSTLDAEARRRGIGEVGYGIRDTWVDLAEVVPKIAPMTIGEVNNMVTALAELHEHYTQDLYALLEDTHDSRTRISQRVTIDSQRVDLLMEDRTAHQETILIVEEEDYTTREA